MRIMRVGVQVRVWLLAASLVSLLLPLVMLVWWPSLRCPRNTLHSHMFLSLALNNIAWLLW